MMRRGEMLSTLAAMRMPPRVAITGGPGVGKSTLLQELSRLGYRTMSESTREVIRERVAQGLPPRPEPPVFAAEILARDIEKYGAVESVREPVFFDRTAVEALAMLAGAIAVDAADRNGLLATIRYHGTVFVLPPWREIYVTDSERDQSYEEAERVDARVRDCYLEAGYTLVDVPRTTVSERVAFVLRSLRL